MHLVSKPLRIIIADTDLDVLKHYCAQIAQDGLELVGETTSGRKLVDVTIASRPDAIITEVYLDDLDGISAAVELSLSCPTPVIVVTHDKSKQTVERALGDHVMAYHIKPIEWATLRTTLYVACNHFKAHVAAAVELDRAQRALAERDTIEAAKRILMRRTGLDEAAAYRRLQQISGSMNVKLTKVAEAIVITDGARDA